MRGVLDTTLCDKVKNFRLNSLMYHMSRYENEKYHIFIISFHIEIWRSRHNTEERHKHVQFASIMLK
jgi:hypothetical protein